MDLALLLLRIVAGLTLAAHGSQKLFGWFDGAGIEGTGRFFASLGYRPGKLFAIVGGLSEFFGGLLIMLGLLTPVGAAAVVGMMVTAIAAVHWKNGFFNTKGGIEFPLLVATAAAVIGLMGPGAYSLDRALNLSPYSFETGLGGVALGLLASIFVSSWRAAGSRLTQVRSHSQ